MKGEKYYKWKRMKTTSGRFDDGSVIRIVKYGGKKYCNLQIRRRLLEGCKEGDSIVLYYSNKGYLGISQEESKKYTSYSLRKGNSKNYFEIRGGVISRFFPRKYFEDDVEREGSMIIIKVEFADEKNKIIKEDLIEENSP